MIIFDLNFFKENTSTRLVNEGFLYFERWNRARSFARDVSFVIDATSSEESRLRDIS